MSVTFKAVGRSDVGRVRTNNEDGAVITIVEREDGNYDAWLVADGMGGLAQGEVASGLALETAVKYLREVQSWDDPGGVLHAAFLAANAAVFERGTSSGELTQSGMGTTLVAVLAEEASGRYWVGNVGDSRAYLLSPMGVRQITHDHSLVADRVRLGELTEEEARTARHRNVITRAIGVERLVEPEIMGPAQFHESESVLLCSDGLHGMVTDDEIAGL
ncbi:MAG: protein phosphatase 2C domain-containing protein, partial [Tepidiformaceae bacterium]